MGESGFRWQTMVSGLIGGAAGGLLVWWLAPTPEVDVRPDEAAESVAESESPRATGGEGDDGDASAEARRIDRLESRLRSLQKRVAEQATVDAREEPAEDGDDEGRITLRATDPKFQSAVRAGIDSARSVEDDAKSDARDDRQDRRVAKQVDELAEKLDLSEEQTQKIEIALQTQSDAFGDLRESDDRPVTRKEWREKIGGLRAATRKELAGFLDAGQLEAYDKHQEDNSGRRPSRRGR
jgi:hypothetical protein